MPLYISGGLGDPGSGGGGGSAPSPVTPTTNALRHQLRDVIAAGLKKQFPDGGKNTFPGANEENQMKIAKAVSDIAPVLVAYGITLGAVGGASNDYGATINGTVLTLQLADSGHPGLISGDDYSKLIGLQPGGKIDSAPTTSGVVAKFTGLGSTASTFGISNSNSLSSDLLNDAVVGLGGSQGRGGIFVGGGNHPGLIANGGNGGGKAGIEAIGGTNGPGLIAQANGGGALAVVAMDGEYGYSSAKENILVLNGYDFDLPWYSQVGVPSLDGESTYWYMSNFSGSAGPSLSTTFRLPPGAIITTVKALTRNSYGSASFSSIQIRKQGWSTGAATVISAGVTLNAFEGDAWHDVSGSLTGTVADRTASAGESFACTFNLSGFASGNYPNLRLWRVEIRYTTTTLVPFGG